MLLTPPLPQLMDPTVAFFLKKRINRKIFWKLLNISSLFVSLCFVASVHQILSQTELWLRPEELPLMKVSEALRCQSLKSKCAIFSTSAEAPPAAARGTALAKDIEGKRTVA